MIPVISYIGRLTDSRKGLPIFVDAIELLLNARLPSFRVRIVGGSEDEARAFERDLWRVDAIRGAMQAGRVEVWSRVNGAALPEIYSRSTVVCLPSLREQFGMVAVEAMMCGTPIVAARTGGLRDLVVQDLTGYLVDRANAPALAAALAQFIRNKRLGAWMGHNAAIWSRQRFELAAVAESYIYLYRRLIANTEEERATSGTAPLTQDKSGNYLNSNIFEKYRHITEELIKSNVTSYVDVSSSPTPSFVITTGIGDFFLKIHQERPPSLNCLVNACSDIPQGPIAPERIKLARLLTKAPVVPRIIAADESSGILVQEFLRPEATSDACQAEYLMKEASVQLQSSFVIDSLNGSDFLEALDIAAGCSDYDAVKKVDLAAAKLSSETLGVASRLRKCHPQIELLRIYGALQRDCWGVPSEFAVRAKSLIRFLVSERPLVRALPRLQHGSMKREHLMRRLDGSAAVCDLDHAGLYVGPHDIAHWFHDEHARADRPSPHVMLSRIRDLTESDEEAFLGGLWLAIFPLFAAQWRFARGNWRIRPWDVQFLVAYQEAFRKIFTR